jgi:hypothetical protein
MKITARAMVAAGSLISAFLCHWAYLEFNADPAPPDSMIVPKVKLSEPEQWKSNTPNGYLAPASGIAAEIQSAASMVADDTTRQYDATLAVREYEAKLVEFGMVFLHESSGSGSATVDDLVLRLCEVLDRGSDEARAASAAVLDELSAANPEALACAFNNQPDLLANQPDFRAHLMARVDLGSGGARFEVERYLSRSDVMIAEKSEFVLNLFAPAESGADILPSPTASRSRNDAGYFITLAHTAGAWLSAGTFPDLQEDLEDLLEIAAITAEDAGRQERAPR